MPKLSPRLETKIRLHTFYQLIKMWLPPGHPMAEQSRRVLVEGKPIRRKTK